MTSATHQNHDQLRAVAEVHRPPPRALLGSEPNPRTERGGQARAAGVDAQGRDASVGLEPFDVRHHRHPLVRGVADGVGQGHGALGQVDRERAEHRLAGAAGGADGDLVGAGGHVGLRELAVADLAEHLRAVDPDVGGTDLGGVGQQDAGLAAGDRVRGCLVDADQGVATGGSRGVQHDVVVGAGLDGDAGGGRRGADEADLVHAGREPQGPQDLAQRHLLADGLPVDLHVDRRTRQCLHDVDRARRARQRRRRELGDVGRSRQPADRGRHRGPGGVLGQAGGDEADDEGRSDEQPVAQRPLTCSMTTPHGQPLSHGPRSSCTPYGRAQDDATRARLPDQTPG